MRAAPFTRQLPEAPPAGPPASWEPRCKRFLKNNRIKYLKGPAPLPCKLVKGTTTPTSQEVLDFRTGYCISDSPVKIKVPKQTNGAMIQNDVLHLFPAKHRAGLWLRERKSVGMSCGAPSSPAHSALAVVVFARQALLRCLCTGMFVPSGKIAVHSSGFVLSHCSEASF